jgi:hypothetical protein
LQDSNFLSGLNTPSPGFVSYIPFIVRSSEVLLPQAAEKWLFGRCDARELADKASGRDVQARQELGAEAFNIFSPRSVECFPYNRDWKF